MWRAILNFRMNYKTMRTASAALIAGCSALACGSSDHGTSGANSQVSPKVSFTASGTLLASADVGNGSVVQFRDISGLGIVAIGVGPAKAPRVDPSLVVGKSVTDIYRNLAGTEPPQALVDAEKSYADRPIGPGATDDKNPVPTQEATHQELGGLSSLEDAWSDQATWFQSTFCTGVGTGVGTTWDQGWCPLNYGWAHSGWGAVQKAYFSAGATTDSGGTLWLDKVSNGSWQRQYTINLPTWAYGWINLVGAAQYRSGMDSSTGSNRVEFSERYRYAIPTISQILPNFPDNSPYTFREGLQGITHDENNWYMTRNDYVNWCSTASRGVINRMAFVGSPSDPLRPLYYGPSGGGYYSQELQNAGLVHFGDLVHVNGLLYVAVDSNGSNGSVAVFNTSLQFKGYKALENWSGGVAGLAYNPRDGLYWAVTNDGSWVKGYLNGGGQGGKATAMGNLFWSEGYDPDRPFGIYAIDLLDGYVQYFYSWSKGSAQEFEGIDIYNFETDKKFGAYSGWGQIHLMETDPDCGTDDEYWLAHARVSDPAHL